MARPSLKNQRRDQILDAVEHCIARHGVEGATLERIAEKAELARPLIRHNVGNREELLQACFDRFIERSNREAESMLALLPEEDTIKTLVEWLFDEQYWSVNEVLVTSAFTAWGADQPETATRIKNWTMGFVNEVAAQMKQAHPEASEETVQACAAGVVNIYFSMEGMAPVGDMPELRAASKNAALMLIRNLDG